MPGRHDRHDHPRHRRHDERKREHARIDRHLADARNVNRCGLHEQEQRRARDCEAERPADQRERGLFDDRVRDEPRAGRAECRPDRGVAHSADRSRQRQVRQVGAGNQQDRADGAEQQQQTAPRAADDGLGQRRDDARERHCFVGLLRHDVADLRLQHVELGARLFPRHAAPQSRDRLVVVVALPPDALGVHVNRNERIHVHRRPPARNPKAGGKHADDRARFAVEHERAADHRGIRAEPAAPQTGADHRDLRSLARLVV